VVAPPKSYSAVLCADLIRRWAREPLHPLRHRAGIKGESERSEEA